MFGRGFKVFTLFGIPVHVDWTFLLVVPLFAWLISGNFLFYARLIGLERAAIDLAGVEGGQVARPGIAFAFGALMTIGLYASVLVHEFGHALTARIFGVKTERVTLWFLGGVAGFERMPRQPGAEAVVAIVGPLVSYAVAGLLAVTFVLTPDAWLLARLTIGSLSVLNLILATFNLLPALPLDGGRVLRSVLALFTTYPRATQIAAGVAKVIAVGLIAWGLFGGGLMMIAVAIFVWMAVNAETRQSIVESLLKGVRVGDVMTPADRVLTVTPDLPAGELLERMRQTGHLGFPVVGGDGVVRGMVAFRDLQAGFDPTTPVGEYARRGCLRGRADEPAQEAMMRMAKEGYARCAVVDADGRLVGLVTKNDLLRFMQLHAARKRAATLYPGPRRHDGTAFEPHDSYDPYTPPRPA